MQTHALVFDAFEVSRTRVADRLIATFAFDLRDVAWQPGAVAVASARLRPSAGAAAESVLLHADCAGSAYAVPEPQQVRRDGEIALNRAARRDLERAAGGFFLIDAELCDHDQSAPTPRAPRIASLTVQARDTGAAQLSAWVAA